MSDDTCTVCEGRKTVHRISRDQTCYRCGGCGKEPMLPNNYGGKQSYCRECTVIGGGHRTACPDR